MTTTLEREIKLRFTSPAEAREKILAAGATPIRGRRLQEDCLLDNSAETVRLRRCVLRLRIEPGRSLLTYKGPVQPSAMKLREELETIVSDGDTLLRLLDELGFHVWFRYQKYREEFGFDDVIVALDETPIGTFVEIEGGEPGINEMARALGQTPADYLVDSYRTLFCQHRDQQGLPCRDMLFEEP
jgi:adenylate cyclase, class 2